METLTIEFEPNLKSKIIEMLSAFSSSEVKIVQKDPIFEANKRKLKLVSDKIENGTAKFCSFEELDAVLEKTISGYEN